MVLKVGERYRGMWLGEPDWLWITAIKLYDDGSSVVYYKRDDIPRWLSFLNKATWVDGTAFIKKIEDAKRMDAVRAAMPKSKLVDQVEVRYR